MFSKFQKSPDTKLFTSTGGNDLIFKVGAVDFVLPTKPVLTPQRNALKLNDACSERRDQVFVP